VALVRWNREFCGSAYTHFSLDAVLKPKGLLGSRYFATHPTVALGSLVADMFLPLYSLYLLTVWGVGESDLGDLARRVSKSLDVEVQDDPQPQRNII